MPDVRYIVECDASGAIKSIKDVDATINAAAGTTAKAGGASGPFAGLFTRFTAGVLAAQMLTKGIGGIKGVVEDAIKGAIEEEKAENNLRATLEITGRTIEGNLKHYLDFAMAQMKYTTYTHEEVQATQTLLLQLTNLNQNGVDKATKGAMGLASTLGIDLHSATMMVTKAMEGNYMALGRVGIKVDENLKGDEKQAALLDKLITLYSRSTAETNTFGGALKQLGNNWRELKEQAGGALLETEGLKDSIVKINKALSDFVASGKFKQWLEGIIKYTPILRHFLAGIEEWAVLLELEATKAEHAKKVNEGLATTVGILGQVYGKAAPMLKIFGGGLGDLIEMFIPLKKEIDETGKKHHVLTEEEKKAIEAKKKLAQAAQEIIDKYDPLRAGIHAIITDQQKLTEAYKSGVITEAQYRTGMDACEKSLRGTADAISETFTPAARDMSLVMAAAPGAFNETEEAARGVDLVFQAIGESMGVSAATVRTEMWNMAADILAAYGIIIGKMPEIPAASKTAAEQTQSYWQEVSTVIADSMRNIASEVVKLFNLEGLMGAKPKTVTFDTSYYDQMVATAEAAYDRERSLIEASNDARIRSATKAYDAQELLLTRAQEDQDRARDREYAAQDLKYERQYENQKRAIQNSKMTEKQKEDALLALETKYEDAKIAREQRREDQGVARERRREDQKLKREIAHEKKLEEIRAAGLQKLLDLQVKHQTDLDAIRAIEDAAREAQAKKEEERQKSLWFKVKGIFATAVQEMATIWLTRFIQKMISGLFDVGASIAKNVATPVSSIASAAGQAASGFLSAAGSVGSIITAITSIISLLKGPQKQTDVTYWLKLQWELLQNTYNFYIGALTWKLDKIANAVDGAMKPTLWKISTAGQLTKDYTKSCRDYLKTANIYLKSIDHKLPLKTGQAGAVSTQTELMFVHGTPTDPEFTFRGSQLGMFASAGPGGGSRTINVLMPIYLGGEKIDERMFRIARGQAEWLDSEYQRSNRRIPARTSGG